MSLFRPRSPRDSTCESKSQPSPEPSVYCDHCDSAATRPAEKLRTARSGGPHTGVEKSTWNALHVSFIGLSAILCATCVAGWLSKFRLHRWWIFALLGYYGVYMVVEAVIALLAE